jgi:hypothetical protein
VSLAKHIQGQLLPIQDDDDDDAEGASKYIAAFPLATIEDAIKCTLSRNNYGLEPPPGGKSNSSVSVWRWEVKPEHKDWLPEKVREKAAGRHMERVRVRHSLSWFVPSDAKVNKAKDDLLGIFESLPDEEKRIIFPGYQGPFVPKKNFDSVINAPSTKSLVFSNLAFLTLSSK